jgi:Family of unknown function (DUF6152)
MRTRMTLLFVALVVSTAVLPSFAHHSFSAEYDAQKPVTFKGYVTKLEWMNPHVWFYVEVKDDNGSVVQKWDCEAANPNALARQGWKRDSLKVGDLITVEGSRAKDGSFTMNARSIILASGKRVLAGSSGDGGPER